MAGVKCFEDLAVWQKAREFTRLMYFRTAEGKWAKDFGLRDQIRRASVSIMSNIAEGFERTGENEFGRFLSMAKGSAGEVRCQLYVALDVGYLENETFEELRTRTVEVSKMISGLAEYIKKDRSARSRSAVPAADRS